MYKPTKRFIRISYIQERMKRKTDSQIDLFNSNQKLDQSKILSKYFLSTVSVHVLCE
jgi:penicillin V acylase-like amidase (Ntn superfamily)